MDDETNTQLMRLSRLLSTNHDAMRVMTNMLVAIAEGTVLDPEGAALEALQEVDVILHRTKDYTVDDILNA